jgi:hypothetical protein
MGESGAVDGQCKFSSGIQEIFKWSIGMAASGKCLSLRNSQRKLRPKVESSASSGGQGGRSICCIGRRRWPGSGKGSPASVQAAIMPRDSDLLTLRRP